VIALVALACAHAASPPPVSEADFDDPLASMKPDAAPVAPPSVAPPAPALPPGTIARADVNRVLDGGIGKFLRRVRIKALHDGDRFQGWLVLDVQAAMGLVPGDVVLRVNGRVIERPEEAQDVWDSLRKASTLIVTYLHEGQERELRFTISD
jgi:type II secretory pathway component PulC